MGTTPKYAIPYVEPADLLTNYPVTDKAAALAIEAAIGAGGGGGQADRISRWKNANQALTTAYTEYSILYENDDGNGTGITYAPGIFTVNTAGVYQMNACVQFIGHAVGTILTVSFLRDNNATLAINSGAAGNTGVYVASFCRAFRLGVGQTIQFRAKSSAAGVSVTGGTTRVSYVDITMVAP